MNINEEATLFLKFQSHLMPFCWYIIDSQSVFSLSSIPQPLILYDLFLFRPPLMT